MAFGATVESAGLRAGALVEGGRSNGRDFAGVAWPSMVQTMRTWNSVETAGMDPACLASAAAGHIAAVRVLGAVHSGTAS